MIFSVRTISMVTTLFLLAIVALFDPFSSTAQESKSIKLQSTDIQKDEVLGMKHVYNGFGCSGKNVSPTLMWENAPEGTESFAITVYDPDAPTGSGWWHWIVYNIPADMTELPQDAGSHIHNIHPNIMQGRNDYGGLNYGGACPPAGDEAHRYIFTIYALSKKQLDVPADASAAMIGFNIKANSIAEDSLVATYKR